MAPSDGTPPVPGWLRDVKDKAARDDRPRDKAWGRWLGDFLDQPTVSGLLDTEYDLLACCRTGRPCEPAARPPPAGLEGREALIASVEVNRVRAGFLRFLVLGGDETAPIHEAGVELNNALIDAKLDLRGGQCTGRLLLIGCVLMGEFSAEDARFGLVVLRGTHLDGLVGRRAKFGGSVFLDEGFTSAEDVLMFSAQIAGSLLCNAAVMQGFLSLSYATIGANLEAKGASITKGIAADGAKIAGNVALQALRARRRVNLINAEIGGALQCHGAVLQTLPDDAERTAVMLDFSRARIKGDVFLTARDAQTPFTSAGQIAFASARIGGDILLQGAVVSAGPGKDERRVIDGQNVNVEGSVFFGAGFAADGEVWMFGAEIAKDLDFSDGTFRNPKDNAIVASQAKVTGALRLQASSGAKGAARFQSFGAVWLTGAQCGELICNGGAFDHQNGPALDCSSVKIAGSLFMQNMGHQPFEANGLVNLHSARIGQHLYAGGGRFSNPDGEALNGEAVTVAGCVFLNQCDRNQLAPDQFRAMAFRADGMVNFVGASVGLQFNCQDARFRNGRAGKFHPGYAELALNLAAMRIGDALIMGVDDEANTPEADALPVLIEGSLDLTNASVRELVDTGLIGHPDRGLRPAVAGTDGVERRCNLKLDLFVYERLRGAEACRAPRRLDWLARQPPENFAAAFQPQPFEQLVKVLRAMGHDGDADTIGLAKRTAARRARPWWPGAPGMPPVARWLIKLGELVLVAGFLGYGYRIGRALLILLVLGTGFGAVYDVAFQQGGIVPADKEIRNDPRAAACVVWTPATCPAIADKPIPLFNPWLYSADLMIPAIGFGQKAAWAPTHGKSIRLPVIGTLSPATDAVYSLQITETVFGWIGSLLLLSFVSGLIAKE